MKIGFTGTQEGMTGAQKIKINELLYTLKQKTTLYEDEFHEGDCIGADAEATELAHLIGYVVVCHPPVLKRKRAFGYYDIMLPEKDYLVRNHDIVDASDVVIATPKEFKEELRSGTWATIRYAICKCIKKKDKLLYIVYPDGTTSTFWRQI